MSDKLKPISQLTDSELLDGFNKNLPIKDWVSLLPSYKLYNQMNLVAKELIFPFGVKLTIKLGTNRHTGGNVDYSEPNTILKPDINLLDENLDTNNIYLSISDFKKITVSFHDKNGNQFDPIRHDDLKKYSWAPYTGGYLALIDLHMLCDILRDLLKMSNLTAFL